MPRDPLAVIDAAHHLLWLAADDAGAIGPVAVDNAETAAEACSTLAADAEEAGDRFGLSDRSSADRAAGYLRAAIDLLLLANSDASDAGLPDAVNLQIEAAIDNAALALDDINPGGDVHDEDDA